MHIDPDLLHQAQVIQDIALELGAQEVACFCWFNGIHTDEST